MFKDNKVVKLNVCWQIATASLGGSKHEFSDAAAVEKLRKEVAYSPNVYVIAFKAVSRKRELMEPLHEFCKGGGFDGILYNLSFSILKDGRRSP